MPVLNSFGRQALGCAFGMEAMPGLCASYPVAREISWADFWHVGPGLHREGGALSESEVATEHYVVARHGQCEGFFAEGQAVTEAGPLPPVAATAAAGNAALADGETQGNLAPPQPPQPPRPPVPPRPPHPPVPPSGEAAREAKEEGSVGAEGKQEDGSAGLSVRARLCVCVRVCACAAFCACVDVVSATGEGEAWGLAASVVIAIVQSPVRADDDQRDDVMWRTKRAHPSHTGFSRWPRGRRDDHGRFPSAQ